MKRISFVLGTVLIVLSVISMPLAAAQVSVDGKVMDVKTIVEDGTTLVPLRSIFEAMGISVQWDSNSKTVTATNSNVNVTLRIGSKTAYKNGQPISLRVAGKTVNGVTMVPLRFVAEAFGANVNWNKSNGKITILSAKNTEVKTNLATPSPDVIIDYDVLTWPNGTIYRGRTVNGVVNGPGTYILADGTTFTGEFTNGLLNGQGTMNHSNGARYNGEFVDGKFDGLGILTYSDGTRYEGEFRNGLRHGKGIVYGNDYILVGQFKNGELDGECTLICLM